MIEVLLLAVLVLLGTTDFAVMNINKKLDELLGELRTLNGKKA